MLHILFAEDDPLFGTFLQRMLERLGHRPEWVKNGAQALRAARRMTPDALITDILMPELDGFETIRAFRSEFAELPILAMTGEPEAGYLPLALRLGARGALRKPFRESELSEALDSLLLQAEV